MNKNITFSSDIGEITLQDLDETSKISEDYFETKQDSNQISTTQETRDWIYKNVKDYLNIIKNKENIVGYAFMLPCNKKLMDNFILGRITESELFEEIKRIKPKHNPEAIYICASVLTEDFRGKGLATTAFTKAINKITNNLSFKPILFYWKYSEEGGKLANRIAKLTGLQLKSRID